MSPVRHTDWGLRDYGTEPQIWGGDAECRHEWGEELPEHHPGQVEQTKWKNAEAAGKGQTAGSGQFCSLCSAWRGNLGLEPTPALYVAHLVEVFREVRRVLRDDGVVWLNLGDSMSVGSNLRKCLNSVMQGKPLIVSNGATIRITSKTGDIPVEDERFPYRVLLSLLGVERIVIKQRDNDFCQIIHTLADPRYCWLGVPTSRMSMNASTLEVVLDSGYDPRVIISNNDSHGKPELGILGTPGARAGKSGDSALAVKEPTKPITEFVSDGQSIGDAVALNPLMKCLPDVYFVDKAVALRDGLNAMPCQFCNFTITKATPKQVRFSGGSGGGDLTIDCVGHLASLNSFGSLIRYAELYHKAEQMANERQAKQELGIPDMVKRALMRDGWICRSTIIWSKVNCMPESVTDRPTKAHEYVFLLSKSARYFYDGDAVRESANCNSGWAKQRLEGHPQEKRYHEGNSDPGGGGYRGDGGFMGFRDNGTRNKRSVWTIPTHPYSGAHFATFPPDLVEPMIKAGSAEGDTVLDPFGGAGTVGLVSDRLGRDAILCELNEDYAQMAYDRIYGDAPMFAEVEVLEACG